MAHLRCPTSSAISPHIPTLNQLTLASHNRSRNSPSLSPSDSPWAQLDSLARSRLEENDFQSNAQVDVNACPPGFGSSLSGLGIRFSDPLNPYLKDDGERIKTPPSQTQRQMDGSQGQHQDEFAQFSDPYFPRLWSPLPSLSASRPAFNDSARTLACSRDGDSVVSHGLNPNDATWSLHTLAAASGISTHALAEQLSSTADLALRYMTDEHLSFSSLVDLNLSNDVFLNDDRRADWPVLPAYRNDATPVVETTEAKSFTSSSEPVVGINPVDLMADVSYDSDQSRISFALSTSMSSLSHNSLDGFAPSTHSGKKTKRESPSILCDILVDPQQNVVPSSGNDEYQVLRTAESDSNKENSDYEQSLHCPSSRESSPFPSPRPRKRPHAKKKTKHPIRKIPLLKTALAPPKPRPIKTEEGAADINFGTPVLDAHKGIHLDDLKAKAKRYRLRNPGQSYDNRWLVSFAGKLSSQGELVNEFRCYVVGCTQRNKRRDHILIHIGGHLDQRPFECSFCPTRFLRKNECKRHELSHSGNRPFHCELCPGTAFVRQDLLRRHMTRTHGGRRK